jgi:hypothetical protein
MRRREFIATVGGAAAWQIAASAYFAYLGLLTIRDRDGASVLDAASADGASDAVSSTSPQLSFARP